MTTKICNGPCGLELPTTEFHRRGVGWQARCKTCWAAYSKTNYEKNKAAVVARSKKAKAETVALVNDKKNVSCTDCKQQYPPYVMDFDHRDPTTKVDNVAILAREASRAALIAEIAKCDVVCANCHRIRTHQRGYSSAW